MSIRRIERQGVFSEISFPINEDSIAVSMAVRQLLDDGWKLSMIEKKSPESDYHISLKRSWEYLGDAQGEAYPTP